MSNGLSISAMRLPATPLGWIKLLLGVTVVALIYFAYWVQPVAYAKPLVSCYAWLTYHWGHVSNYAHGPLIPMIAAWLLWRKRAALREAQLEPSATGQLVVGVAMLVYYIGVKGSQPHTVVASFILLLYGVTLALAGRTVFAVLFFPISFLWLMVPLNFLDEQVGFPLRMFVASASTNILNWLGITTVQRGSGIISSVFRFDIADPCSGIRSLMALTTVTAAYAYVTQRAQWKRWLLFVSAAPLAVLGNLARVISIALVAQVYGQGIADRVYHDWSGYILFLVAFAGMVIFGLLLDFNYRHAFEKLTQPPEPRYAHE